MKRSGWLESAAGGHVIRRGCTSALLAALALVAACGGGGGGGSGSASEANLPPTPSFTTTPPTGLAPLAVQFDASASADPDGSITGYRWTFGDGTANGSGAVTGHTFTAAGNYVVTLTVTDDRGTSASTTRTVAVLASSVGGHLLLSSNVQVDGDVNDPSAPYRANDTAATAQSVPNPLVLGGYVNQPARGAEGRSYASGDPDDVYRVTLAAGQVIDLVVPTADAAQPDAQRDDADLYLYDANQVLVDASVGVDPYERLTAPAAGTYFVRVGVHSGAPIYRLSIGQATPALATSTLRLSDEFVPGEVIVTLRSSKAPVATREKAAAGLESAYGLRRKAGDHARESLLAIPENAQQVLAARKVGPGARQAGFIVPQALERKLETLLYVKQLQGDPAVRAAMPNRIAIAHAVPNDPGYATQRWHYELIHGPEAWNVTTGSADVVVAVVDTGVYAHPDLAANLTGGYDLVSTSNNADLDGIDPDPDDPGCILLGRAVYHGTHVAGTIAAVSNNGIGVAGVSWTTRIMPVRVLDSCSNGGSAYDVLQGIRYAAGLENDSGHVPARRADVINLSLGIDGTCDQVLVDLTGEVRAAGAVMVGSAGNAGADVEAAPAACPNVIAVAAVGPTRQRASYSSFGSTWIDVAAPGGEMRADFNGDGQPDGVYSTFVAGGGTSRRPIYHLLEGTSMAVPHVAGVLALMKAVRPGLTPGEVDQFLAQGQLTDDIGPAGPDSLGVGLINAFKAVSVAGGGGPVLPPELSATPSSLAFGDAGTRAEVVLSNGGSGVLTVTGATSSAAWLRASPVSVDAQGLGRYAVTVDRAGLQPGTYSGWIDFGSSAGTKRVAVIMQVAVATLVPSAGWHYVMLLDAESNAVVRTLGIEARGSSVPYRFDDVPAGTYLVMAGTDMDHDGRVCDEGEACGAYPVESDMAVVTVPAGRLDLDFSTTFRTGL